MVGSRCVNIRAIRCLTAFVVCACGAGNGEVFGDGSITVNEIAADYSWGYRCGVKQPLGAYKNGLSVHQITKSNYPDGVEGNPDYLFWVEEDNAAFGVAMRPTDQFHGYVTNPGGMVSFSSDGTLWYTYGARAQNLPLDLYSSLQPYDTSAFARLLHDFDPSSGSTTPCVNVHDPKLLLFWRHRNSGAPAGAVRFRRYDINGTFASPEIEMELGHAVDLGVYGLVGIEQLWTRHDPRFGYTLLTWQFFANRVVKFGSNPFLYTDDDGETWRTADGAAWIEFPIRYSDINDVLVPFDHIAQFESTGWLVSDLGVSPHGTFWMTLRSSFDLTVTFWYFDGAEWVGRELAQIDTCKPHACGVTRDYIVFVYADAGSRHLLKTRFSADDGRTWSHPIVVDDVDTADRICWVSFVQPADAYTDNHARFFYGHARTADAGIGAMYQNSVRWIRLDPAELPVGDIDGDGIVGILDFLDLLEAWGPCADCGDCPADLDGDCMVGISDFLLLLGDWG
jgi:hypothetical protein